MTKENNQKNIRNFCIIAHIDHGKSTLADRFLEITATVDKRKMREQFLDQMDLERERGITIKMQPVRMDYGPRQSDKEYILNLIDTPGHIDFSYEVSRSLKAVEGAVLLVDATQGVQAQTVANLSMAKSLGLVVIPVVNKIDSPYAKTEETKKEITEILGCPGEEILEVSAKTGENVDKLIEAIIQLIPPPKFGGDGFRGLIFDFDYSAHKGITLYVRIVGGSVKKGDNLFLMQANSGFAAVEVGIFNPFPKAVENLGQGEIGYITTGVKQANIAHVGDTVIFKGSKTQPLEGYKRPLPVVWAGIYPESQDDFPQLKQSLERLNLSDSALTFEVEESGLLGRGFRCGFLGMLHLEIVSERIRREFGLKTIITTPGVVYRISMKKGGIKEVYSPTFFPDFFEINKISEPWAEVKIISPFDKLNDVLQVVKNRKAVVGDIEDFGQARLVLACRMPLRKMVANFFEDIKSATSGYASFDYSVAEYQDADVAKLDILLNDEVIPTLAKIVDRDEMQREARKTADKLKELLPRELFAVKIQIKALGRILAASSITALKKDVTGYLYGGDRTRKMKLWAKQKRGKERLKKFGRVNVPHDVFIKMMQRE